MSIKRWNAKSDSNQAQIVKTVNAHPYCTVLDLSGVGGGCTDLLVQYRDSKRSELFLIEVKTPVGKLNKKQVKFHAEFHAYVARSADDVFRIVGA